MTTGTTARELNMIRCEQDTREGWSRIEHVQRGLLFAACNGMPQFVSSSTSSPKVSNLCDEMLNSEVGSWFQAVTHVRTPAVTVPEGLAHQRQQNEKLMAYATTFPEIAYTIQRVYFPNIFTQPKLTAATVALIKIAALTASGHSSEIAAFIAQASELNLTQEVIAEVMLQTAYFAGFPNGANALIAIKDMPCVTATQATADPAASLTAEEIYQRGLALLNKLHGEHTGKGILEAFGAVCPKMADMTIRTIFGDLLYRPALPINARELTILAALVTLGQHCQPQIVAHAEAALSKSVGVTKGEIVEAIAHTVGIASLATVFMAVRDINSIVV